MINDKYELILANSYKEEIQKIYQSCVSKNYKKYKDYYEGGYLDFKLRDFHENSWTGLDMILVNKETREIICLYLSSFLRPLNICSSMSIISFSNKIYEGILSIKYLDTFIENIFLYNIRYILVSASNKRLEKLYRKSKFKIEFYYKSEAISCEGTLYEVNNYKILKYGNRE